MGGGARAPAERVRAAPALAVRQAVAADLDAIHAIELASFSDPWSRTSIRDVILGGATIVVATDGDRVIGFAVTVIAADQAEVANVAVAPAERRRGAGALLVDHVVMSAEAAGTASIFLEVRESNAAAIALYVARGFREVARRRQYYRKPDEDAIVMRRDAIR